MAYTDLLFQMGMAETLKMRVDNMGRMKDFHENIENLVYEAIEYGANTTDGIYAYVTQYVPPALVSFKMVEDIAIEYSTTNYEPDNVY